MATRAKCGLESAAQEWRRRKRDEEAEARERVVLQIGCGVDAAAALASRGEDRDRLIRRLRRLIERDRIRAGGPAGYDLDRHRTLKTVLDGLEGRATTGGRIAPWRRGDAAGQP